MKVKDLKRIIKSFTDDADVILVGWNGESSVLKTTHQCCNFEHQVEKNQLWLSMEGLRINPVEIVDEDPDGDCDGQSMNPHIANHPAINED